MKKRYEIVFDSKDDISIQTKQEFIYDKVFILRPVLNLLIFYNF